MAEGGYRVAPTAPKGGGVGQHIRERRGAGREWREKVAMEGGVGSSSSGRRWRAWQRRSHTP